MEKDSQWLARVRGDGKSIPDTDTFNQERFNAMKARIKQRKEAKERLSQQGFADLKAYSRM